MTDQQAADTAPRFAMRAHYTKDLSFENPNAPASLMGGGDEPKVDLNVNLNATRVQDTIYELSMQFSIRTTADKTLFIVDLTYSGLFEVSNIPEDKMEQLLMVDCAFLLFPFARRVIADATRDGGYAPLMLEPVDFYALFTQRQQEQAQGEQA